MPDNKQSGGAEEIKPNGSYLAQYCEYFPPLLATSVSNTHSAKIIGQA